MGVYSTEYGIRSTEWGSRSGTLEMRVRSLILVMTRRRVKSVYSVASLNRGSIYKIANSLLPSSFVTAILDNLFGSRIGFLDTPTAESSIDHLFPHI